MPTHNHLVLVLVLFLGFVWALSFRGLYLYSMYLFIVLLFILPFFSLVATVISCAAYFYATLAGLESFVDALGHVVLLSGGILPSPHVIPSEVKLANGSSKPAFYVLVLTEWGYIAYQLLSERLVKSFLTSCALANLVTYSCHVSQVSSKLALFNTPANLTNQFKFYFAEGKVVCNNLAAINGMLPSTCQRLEFNKMPVALPAPVIASQIKASLITK